MNGLLVLTREDNLILDLIDIFGAFEFCPGAFSLFLWLFFVYFHITGLQSKLGYSQSNYTILVFYISVLFDPDRFPAYFYQKAWKVVGRLIVAMVLDVL